MIEQQLERIRGRTAKVGVVGLGYVGLPFAVEKAKAGFTVVGIDRNEDRVAMVNSGSNYIPDVVDEELAQVVEDGLLIASSNPDSYEDLDVIVICVPTPLTESLEPDLRFVRSVAEDISGRLKSGQLISLESTTYPGTTDEVLRPILEASGLTADEDFFLAHSPERVDPGNKRYTTKNTNKVVGGIGPNSLVVAKAFYEQTIDHVVPVSSARIAEMTKVYENTYRAVNIALVNEMAKLCDKMGIDVWEMLDAAFTKPFGIQAFYPGPGVGGHCIPIDPHYLEWKAKELDFETKFIHLAGETNRSMPKFVVSKSMRILERDGIEPSSATVLLLGIAYKKDLGDCRESPALEVYELLSGKVGTVQYHDPFVASLSEVGLEASSVDLSLIETADLVIITTDHSDFDYGEVIRNSNRILDTRNATRGLEDSAGKVTLL